MNNKKIISELIGEYEKLEESGMVQADLYKSVKPVASWVTMAILIILFFFALINVNRFFLNERFSNLVIS